MGKKATYLFPLSDTPIARGSGKENKLGMQRNPLK